MKTKSMYWERTGKYQKESDKLQKLIPFQGEVNNPTENPALEKFRKASNCYYDLYNNGLCNREQEFKEVFGFDGTDIIQGENDDWYSVKLEHKIDKIIEAACKEQNIKIEGVE